MVRSSLSRLPIEFGLIPGAFVVAAVVARQWLASAPPGTETDFAQPLAVVTSWHQFGASLWAVLLAAVACAGIAYLFTLRRLHDSAGGSGLRLPLILAASVLSLAAGLLFPVIFSSDVYAYAAYGDLALHGANPYAHAPLANPDALLSAAIWQWGNPPPMCVYGPLFVWLAKTVVALAGHSSVAVHLLGLRLLAMAALPLCGVLLYQLLHDWAPGRRLAATAALVLNPVAIWSAVEGHNGTLMIAAALLGLLVYRRFNVTLGALLIGCAALIKAPAAALGLLLIVYLCGKRDWTRLRATCIGFFSGLALTALVSLPFETGLASVLVPHGHYTPQFSLQWLLYTSVLFAFPERVHAFELGIALAIVISGALMLRGAREILGGDYRAAALIALGLWLAIPNPYPWYALWVLPVAAITLDSRVGLAVLAATLAIFFRYLPDAADANNLDMNALVTVCELGIPALVLAMAPQRIFSKSGALAKLG